MRSREELGKWIRREMTRLFGRLSSCYGEKEQQINTNPCLAKHARNRASELAGPKVRWRQGPSGLSKDKGPLGGRCHELWRIASRHIHFNESRPSIRESRISRCSEQTSTIDAGRERQQLISSMPKAAITTREPSDPLAQPISKPIPRFSGPSQQSQHDLRPSAPKPPHLPPSLHPPQPVYPPSPAPWVLAYPLRHECLKSFSPCNTLLAGVILKVGVGREDILAVRMRSPGI
jgi:hypothetical protein